MITPWCPTPDSLHHCAIGLRHRPQHHRLRRLLHQLMSVHCRLLPVYECEVSVLDSLSFVSVLVFQLEDIALGIIASEVRFWCILREQSP
jgi:hypothetical protein